jgi:hypothetical protein
MTQSRPTWSAGIVNHGSCADLEACLSSIALQTWAPERVAVWGLLPNLPWLIVWEILRLGFVLLRDRALLSAYREAWQLLGTVRRRRTLIQATARERMQES